MNCKICNEITEPAFKHKVLNKYDVQYYSCNNCGFIQTEACYWLEEAYVNALNMEDTGILVRNEWLKNTCSILFSKCFNPKAQYLDYAGGYGIFTRMMRDIGFNYFWDDKFATNLLARGFEHKNNKKYEAITAFEVFEHLNNPLDEIKEMLSYSNTIVFSTVLADDKTPDENWWYYAFEHGQHIAFYRLKTLRFIAKKLNLNIASNASNFHILSDKKISDFQLKLFYRLAKYGFSKFFRKKLHPLTNSDSKSLSFER